MGSLAGVGVAFGGAAISTFAVATASFVLLCFGTMLLGMYNGFGQYYRFAAADAAPADFKAKAISYVLAGGLVGGIVGPEISKHTRTLLQPEFLASYASLFIYALIAGAGISLLGIPEPPLGPR